jgi:hypothetical protein
MNEPKERGMARGGAQTGSDPGRSVRFGSNVSLDAANSFGSEGGQHLNSAVVGMAVPT